MRPKNSVIIAILLLLAIGLGAAIYYKQYWPKNADKNSDNTNQNEQEAPKPVILSDPEFDANLTEQQKALFYNPGPDASQEQRDEFFKLAEKAAVSGQLISINGCTASPDVLKAAVGSKISVRNTGTTDIMWGVSEDKVAVKAGATVDVTALFKQGSGLYGYGCENPGVRRAIGMVLITP